MSKEEILKEFRGMHGTRFRKIWENMQSRCCNPKHKNFATYGGKGVRSEWATFAEFWRDMSPAYWKHVKVHGERNTTLERLDNDGNCSKANCTWATMKEQRRNRLDTIRVTLSGRTQVIVDWCEELGLKPPTVYSRILRQGMNPKQALLHTSKWLKPTRQVQEYRKREQTLENARKLLEHSPNTTA